MKPQKPKMRFVVWHLMVAATLFTLMMFYVAAWGSTYNFYFPKEGQNEGAPVIKQDPQPVQTYQTGPNTQTIVPKLPGNQPIVIHNQNIQNGGAQVQKTDAPFPEDEEETRRWKVGLMGTIIYANSWDYWEDGYGGTLSMSYRFVEPLGVNFYAGVRTGYGYYGDPIQFFGGGEIEVYPFSLSFPVLPQFLELGGLFGFHNGNNIYLASSLMIYGGVRVNLNFGNEWGLSSSVRANHRSVVAEAGLTRRF